MSGAQCRGFTNAEEEAVGKTAYVPFLLEDKLKELGGLYEAGPDWVRFKQQTLNTQWKNFN